MNKDQILPFPFQNAGRIAVATDETQDNKCTIVARKNIDGVIEVLSIKHEKPNE